jgi:hypothetical protein
MPVEPEIAEEQEQDRALITIDDLVVDEATGEIVRWPDGVGAGPNRLEFIIREHAAASQAIKDYEVAKSSLARAAGLILEESNVKSLATEIGKVTAVAGHEKTDAPATKIVDAVQAELLTDDEATSLLLEAAKELDAKAVEVWISRIDSEPRQKLLRLALLNKSQTRGYTLISRARSKPPKVVRQ